MEKINYDEWSNKYREVSGSVGPFFSGSVYTNNQSKSDPQKLYEIHTAFCQMRSATPGLYCR